MESLSHPSSSQTKLSLPPAQLRQKYITYEGLLHFSYF